MQTEQQATMLAGFRDMVGLRSNVKTRLCMASAKNVALYRPGVLGKLGLANTELGFCRN